MFFITLTRPDGSRIVLNTANILSIVAAAPPDSPLAGPPGAQTRITFSNQIHQDVRQTIDEVLELVSKCDKELTGGIQLVSIPSAALKCSRAAPLPMFE